MNSSPNTIRDVSLAPGEHFFGGGSTRIRTILGSCVAITVWHPKLHVGGMCHYMLPNRRGTRLPSRKGVRPGVCPTGESRELAGRYADEAVELLVREIRRANTRTAEYQTKIFGGGQMFDLVAGVGVATDIGQRNIEAALQLSREHGFQLAAQQLGGRGHLSLFFDLWSGHVWCKTHQPLGAGS